MATTDKTGIQASITASIRTGNSDTTAAELRMVLNEILDSYANVIDGGNVYQSPVGYNYLPTVLGASSFINRDYADLRYAGASIGLDTVLANGNNTNNLPIVSAGSITELKIDDTYSWLKFDDIFTNSGIYLSLAGIELLSDVGLEIDVPYTNIQNAFYQTHLLGSGEQGRIYSDAGNVLTEIILSTGETMQFNLLGSVGAGMSVSNAAVTLSSYITINVVNQAVSDGSNSKMIIDDQVDSKGLVYMADYSSNFTDNSLIHKKFLETRITTPRVTSITSSATPTPNADTDDLFKITALAASAVFAAPSGTPKSAQALLIRVKDNGTARALSFNSIYRFSSDQVAPTTTVINKTIYLGFTYNSTDSKWDCLGWITNI